MRTSRARLGTAVLLAPLHHPLRLAEDLAVVDQLSGGRLDVGLAPGYKPDEFAVLGVPKGERGARTDETIEILKLAWRGERFSLSRASTSRFDDVDRGAAAGAAAGGRPPIWVGGSSLAAARRAARYGTCFMPDSGAGPGRLRRLPDAAAAVPAPGGHQPGSVRRGEPGEGLGDLRRPLPLPVQRVPAVVLRGRGRRLARRRANRSVRAEPRALLRRDPDDLLAAITESQQRLGYEELVFWARPPGMPIEQSTASLELIARHVLPALTAKEHG